MPSFKIIELLVPKKKIVQFSAISSNAKFAMGYYSQNFFFFFFFFLIQFNVPFKIISLIETSQSIGGRNGRTPGKPPDTPASRTWLVSHVASAGLEPTPDTAVR